MKKINWKLLIVTCVICLLPIVLGVAFYQDIPDEIAVHFDINNNPDNYASKEFALFGIPIFMTLLQIFCCVIQDIRANYKGKAPKIDRIVKLIIPVLTVVVYVTMLVIALGMHVDVRKIVCFIIGILFLLIGNYIPKISTNQGVQIGPKSLIENEKVWRKISRMTGYSLVLTGVCTLISIFLPPIYSVLALISSIVLAIINMIYGFFLSKKS